MAPQEPKENLGLSLIVRVTLRTVDSLGDPDSDDILELFHNLSVGPFTFKTHDDRTIRVDFNAAIYHVVLLEDGRVQIEAELHGLKPEPYRQSIAAGIKPEELTPDFITSCRIEQVYYSAWLDAMEDEHIPMDVVELSFGILDANAWRHFSPEAIADYNKERAIYLPLQGDIIWANGKALESYRSLIEHLRSRGELEGPDPEGFYTFHGGRFTEKALRDYLAEIVLLYDELCTTGQERDNLRARIDEIAAENKALVELIEKKDAALDDALHALKCANYFSEDTAHYGKAATAKSVVEEALSLTTEAFVRDTIANAEEDRKIGALIRRYAADFSPWKPEPLLVSWLGVESGLEDMAERRVVMAAAYMFAQEETTRRMAGSNPRGV